MDDAARAKHLPLTIPDPAGVAQAALERAAAPPLTREQLRSRRPREVRARTVSVKRMTKREVELGRLLYPEVDDVARPRTREECEHGEHGARPCPFVSCKHHLYLDVSRKTGSIKINFPDVGPEAMNETCALDAADRGGMTLEEVGAALNLTRERVRQIEVQALAKVQAVLDMTGLRDYVRDEGPRGRRRLPVLVTRDQLLEGDPELGDGEDGELAGDPDAGPPPGDFDVDEFVRLEDDEIA